jgi:hypothetical protein
MVLLVSLLTCNHNHSCPPAAHGVVDPEVDSESDHDIHDGVSDNDEGVVSHAICNSKPHGEAKPSQLGFYSGPWINVPVTARNHYRKMIHTMDPFLEWTPENLRDAHDYLLETIAEHQDDGGQPLDQGVFIFIHF